MVINQGQASTMAITIFGIFAAIIIAEPQILGDLGVPAQYITALVLVITILWNYLKPRALDTPEVEETA